VIPEITKSNANQPRQQQLNLNHAPMDIDAANAIQSKKLTPEECAQLAKEGRCFRCHLQGHMACNCPKNANNASPTIRTNKTTTPPKINTTVTTLTTTPNTTSNTTTKLTHAQQIWAIEEAMTDEE
jgi:hypothetical protein